MQDYEQLKLLGKQALQSGHLTQALEKLQLACRAAPSDAEVWHLLAVLHGMTDNPTAAEECCRRALTLQPQAHAAYNNLGIILKNQGKLTEAADNYRHALALAPNYGSAANNLATVERELGEHAAAIEHYQLAIRLNPGYAEAHSNLGALLQELGRIPEALQCYQHATQLEPDNNTHYYNYACGLREAGNISEAARFFGIVVERDPENAFAWDGLCHTQLELRLYEAATYSGKRAIKLDPAFIQAYLHTGLALYHQHKIDDAAGMFRRTLEIEPENETATYLLAVVGGGRIPDRSPADYVRELFDGYAETFDNALVNKLEYRTPTLIHKLSERYINNLGSNIDMIDIGCGTGLCGPLFRPACSRLVGVDLSPKMVAKAREREVYDKLLVGDLIPALAENPRSFDVVLAADVFVYIGDLENVFVAAHNALRPGGLFIFSTEKLDAQDNVILRKSGRYAHSKGYIASLADRTGFGLLGIYDNDLRKEGNQMIAGNIFILAR